MTLVGADVDVTPVDAGDRDRIRAFTALPLQLHGQIPQWAPTTLQREMRRVLGRRHPYFDHSDAAFFLATQRGIPVGRVAALANSRFIERSGARTAFFGYFECIDDHDVSSALFEAAVGWAADRRLDAMSGPRGVFGYDGTVLVDGFEHPAAIGVPWNPPHYDRLVTAAGFSTERDFLSGWFPPTHRLDPRIHDIADRAMRDGGYVIRTFQSRRQLRAWAPAIADVFVRSMGSLPTFVPPTRAEIDDVIDTLLWVVSPRGIAIVEKDGNPVGFLFSYPDLAEAIRRADGRLFPLGWLHLLLARARERAWVINGLGLVPEHRGLGANAALYRAITETLTGSIGVSRVEVVQVAEDNVASSKDMTALGVRWYKRHRQYRRVFDRRVP